MKSDDYKPALTKFPEEGVCYSFCKELFDYLMSREPMKSSMMLYEGHMKGLAWSKNSMWFVAGGSSKPTYTMEQLYPFIPHIIRTADPEIKGYCVCPNASTRTAEEIKEYFGGLLGRKVSGMGSDYYHYPEFYKGKCSSSKIEPGYRIVSFPEFIRLHERPLTPNECYPPEKWCIKVTEENNAALTEFLKERSHEWKGCSSDIDSWRLANGYFFYYPQAGYGYHSSAEIKPELGYELIGNITLTHIFSNLKHVLTDKQTISTNTLTIRKDGTRRNTIEVQGPTLTVSRGGTIRATGLRCSDSEITVRSGHSPNKTGPIKG